MARAVQRKFTWEAIPEGYKVVDGSDKSGRSSRWLITASDEEARYVEYEPLEDEGLFMTFAKLEPGEEVIRAFACQYGLLGITRMIHVQGLPVRIPGELITEWAKEIRDMSAVVELWGALRMQDEEYLVRHIALEFERGGRLRAATYHYGFMIQDGGPTFEFLTLGDADYAQRVSLMRSWDMERAAYLCMESFISEGLKRFCQPGLLFQSDGDEFAFSVTPTNLIGALWLQLATAVQRDAQFRQCLMCGKWFGIAPDEKKRVTRQYCSDACRVRSYRVRLAEES